jgi:hypothetical protein
MAFYERHGVAPNMDEVAAKHEVPEDDLVELFAVAKRGWLSVEALFPQPLIEVRMKQQILDGVYLVGTADLLDTSDPDHIQLLDWKSGWKATDYWHQLTCYAYMAKRLYGNEDTRVTARIAWLRSREISEHTFTPDQLEAWGNMLTVRVINHDGTYRPGAHCEYCPIYTSCTAQQEMTRSLVSSISESSLPFQDMDSASVFEMKKRLSYLGRIVKGAQDSLKEHIEVDGPRISGGLRLEVVEQTSTTIDPARGWGVLKDFCGEKALMPLLKLPKGKVLSLAKKAGHSAGDVLRELNAAGALRESCSKKLKETKC